MGSEILPLLFILIAGVAVYLFVSIMFAKNNDAQSLSWASADEPIKSKSKIIEVSRNLVHQFTLGHAVRYKNQKYRKRVEKKILTSGLNRILNVDEFIGLQILWGVLFPIIALILNFALQMDIPYLLILAVVPFGMVMPHSHCKAEFKARQISVLADLPFFIDLLALATEAGLDFQGAIQRIVEKAGDASVLAQELNGVLRDITLGSSRAQALKALATRLDIPEINSFVNVVVDADSTGSSIAKVLKDQSIQMRLERFVRAEKAGAQASQLILIPLMLFILPAVFIMVFAPVALQFMYGKQ